MPFGKHACRHAAEPSTSALLDHVWISEDSFASAFRRFANGQRRHESRVPGPLEARRRLAKRKNTALANVAASEPLGDIAGLFGKDGRQHLKWADLKAPSEPQDLQAFPLRPPDVPPPFYNKSADLTKSYTRYGWPEYSSIRDDAVHDQYLDEYMESHWRVAEIKNFVNLLGINVRLNPARSRKIFRRLLSHSLHTEAAVTEAVEFLDDLSLNANGASNYVIAVKHLVVQNAGRDIWSAFFGAVNRALSLGLISSRHICAILRHVSKARTGGNTRAVQDPSALVGYYRGMWEAIGRCDIFNHKQLRPIAIDAFLAGLFRIGPHEDSLSLAKHIIVASHNPRSEQRYWVPKFIIQWLVLSTKSDAKASGDYVNNILSRFTRRRVTENVVCVTESLVLSKDKAALELWQDCLFKFRAIPDLVQSKAWYELKPCCDPTSKSISNGYSSGFSTSHQVLLRLWVLRNLSMAVAKGQYWMWQVPDLAISYLFDFYYYMTRRHDTDHFLTLLMEGIHELSIPPSGLLIAAVDLKTSKTMAKATRKHLELLESSDVTPTTFIDMFNDVDAFNATKNYFFPVYEKLICEIDITSRSFVDESVLFAYTGESKNIWLLLRVLRYHTPLKVAIPMARRRIPDPSEMALVRWCPEPRTQGCPDPHISLGVINALAVAFSCSAKIRPRRAFGLVHWLYRFLRQHHAPVEPMLVRAMYHAGVVQYRRAGLNVPPGQYDYIMRVVNEFEDPVVVRSIMAPPKFG
ncbi:hypothetical protein PHISP_03977 [Aspergillus sp. HF37]|nr:hypothetical protein PHISP_03977 [Aspergillus sp. HF37]